MVAVAILDIAAPDDELIIDPTIGSLYMYTASINIQTRKLDYQYMNSRKCTDDDFYKIDDN